MFSQGRDYVSSSLLRGEMILRIASMDLFSWFVSGRLVGRRGHLIKTCFLSLLFIYAIGHKSEWQLIQPVEAITLPAAVKMAVKANPIIGDLSIENDALFLSAPNNITAFKKLPNALTGRAIGWTQHRSAEIAANSAFESYTRITLRAVAAYLHAVRQRELVALAGEYVEAQRNYLTIAQERKGQQKLTTGDINRVRGSLGSARTKFSRALTKLADVDAAFFHVIKMRPKYLVRPRMPEARLMQKLAPLLIAVTCLTRNEGLSDLEASSSKTELGSQAVRKHRTFGEITSRNNNMRTNSADSNEILFVNELGITDKANDKKHSVFSKKQYMVCLRNSSGLLVFQNFRQGTKIHHYWRALQHERMRLKGLQNDVKVNHRVRNVFRGQFNRRQRTFSELLDAERELFSSKVSQVNSKFIEFFGIYKILAVAGLLPIAFRLGLQEDQIRDDTRHMRKSNAGCLKLKAGVVHQITREIPFDKSFGKDFVVYEGFEKEKFKLFEVPISPNGELCSTNIFSRISLAVRY